MEVWKHEVSFASFYRSDLTLEEKGRLAASRLTRLIKHFEYTDELEEIIEMFNCISGDGLPHQSTEFTVTEDFDARMFDLYEWADQNRVWVKTW